MTLSNNRAAPGPHRDLNDPYARVTAPLRASHGVDVATIDAVSADWAYVATGSVHNHLNDWCADPMTLRERFEQATPQERRRLNRVAARSAHVCARLVLTHLDEEAGLANVHTATDGVDGDEEAQMGPSDFAIGWAMTMFGVGEEDPADALGSTGTPLPALVAAHLPDFDVKRLAAALMRLSAQFDARLYANTLAAAIEADADIAAEAGLTYEGPEPVWVDQDADPGVEDYFLHCLIGATLWVTIGANAGLSETGFITLIERHDDVNPMRFGATFDEAFLGPDSRDETAGDFTDTHRDEWFSQVAKETPTYPLLAPYLWIVRETAEIPTGYQADRGDSGSDSGSGAGNDPRGRACVAGRWHLDAVAGGSYETGDAWIDEHSPALHGLLWQQGAEWALAAMRRGDEEQTTVPYRVALKVRERMRRWTGGNAPDAVAVRAALQALMARADGETISETLAPRTLDSVGAEDVVTANEMFAFLCWSVVATWLHEVYGYSFKEHLTERLVSERAGVRVPGGRRGDSARAARLHGQREAEKAVRQMVLGWFAGWVLRGV